MRAAAALVLVLAIALPAVAAPPRRATLKLESLAPLTVSGRSFGAREPVILSYVAADLTRRVAGVRSTPKGRLRHAFELRVDRCAAFTIRAVGLRGSRAVLQVDPMCKERRGGPHRRASLEAPGATAR